MDWKATAPIQVVTHSPDAGGGWIARMRDGFRRFSIPKSRRCLPGIGQVQAFPTIGKSILLFPPCAAVFSLIKAVSLAAHAAVSGEIVLLSPACSGPDKSLDHQDWGDVFCRTGPDPFMSSIRIEAFLPVEPPSLSGATRPLFYRIRTLWKI